MISIDELLAAPLPLRVVYAGKEKVSRKLQRLTIVEWADLNIGFLSAAGSKAAKLENGDQMWILDVAMHYELTPSGKGE